MRNISWATILFMVLATALLMGCEIEGDDNPDAVGDATGDTVVPVDSATITVTAQKTLLNSRPTIKRGGTVTFVNQHSETHNFKFDGANSHLDTGDILPGGSQTRTFSTVGRFTYEDLYESTGVLSGYVDVEW